MYVNYIYIRVLCNICTWYTISSFSSLGPSCFPVRKLTINLNNHNWKIADALSIVKIKYWNLWNIVMKISIKHSKKHLSFNKGIFQFFWNYDWINKNEISLIKNVIKDKKKISKFSWNIEDKCQYNTRNHIIDWLYLGILKTRTSRIQGILLIDYTLEYWRQVPV